MTCKDGVDETVGEEPAVFAEERLGPIPESESDDTLGEEAAVSAEGCFNWRKGRIRVEGSESEPQKPRRRLCGANEECRYVYKCIYEHTL